MKRIIQLPDIYIEMNYVGNVIRPPSEADAIILQVTVGCSYNKCTFCGAYKDVPFQLKSSSVIDSDLSFAQKYCRHQNRLFLADGDVLILSQRRLVNLFKRIHEYLPWIKRISLYANCRAIRSKSEAQLQELKALGLDRLYLGLESGCNDVLSQVQKGETALSMIQAAEKIGRVGIFLSVTTLLGLGGKELSIQHSIETARVLCRMSPRQIAVLTLMPLSNTVLGQKILDGTMSLPEPHEIMKELHLLVRNLHGLKCQFHANHASTYLPLAGRLPKDKPRILKEIEDGLRGLRPLVPENRRAL